MITPGMDVWNDRLFARRLAAHEENPSLIEVTVPGAEQCIPVGRIRHTYSPRSDTVKRITRSVARYSDGTDSSIGVARWA